MANEYKLSYTAKEIDEKLARINTIESNVNALSSEISDCATSVASLKTSVSEGKSLIASAVTDKGVQTADDATFAVMAANIEAIEVGVDTSNDTVTPETLAEGVTAHDAAGNAIVGTMAGGGGGDSNIKTITIINNTDYVLAFGAVSVDTGEAATLQTQDVVFCAFGCIFANDYFGAEINNIVGTVSGIYGEYEVGTFCVPTYGYPITHSGLFIEYQCGFYDGCVFTISCS